MKKIISIALCSCAIALTSCEDLFEPAIENTQDIDAIHRNPNYAEGLLGNAYARIPGYSWNDPATDDAVTNNASNSFRQIASGTWTSSNNPLDTWSNSRSAIQYINLLLDHADQVNWADDEVASAMYRDRFKGEAYALRALYMYYLLRAHAGVTADGQLLGVPIVTVPEGSGTNFNIPRNTFTECLQAIRDDVARAMSLLPIDYSDTDNAAMASKYEGADNSHVIRVFGQKFAGRISGRIAEAILAQAEFLAASPAYQASGVTWAEAADASAKVLDRINGVQGIDPTGWHWFNNADDIKNLTDGLNVPEMIWRSEKDNSNSLETNNFPPTLYGNGEINPTQNLVDAFPMANGYPIDNANSHFDPSDPYNGRDPRLTTYILCDGNVAGTANSVIRTSTDGGTNDGINVISTSTRTGYYLKKHLRQDVNCNPSNSNTQQHYTARIRYTELFLDYAEAANEAWGPTGAGTHSYSAYDVIKAIRSRAGIGVGNSDPYLESIKSDKEMMRQLIRNERRIELCFEGFRFWDLRRWKADLNETAKGVQITGTTFNVVDVDTRNFKDYMIYGPIPNSEVLKFSELKQNAGW
ncbi:MAG: RagB/SusD family nutrient uptake outer membrane protein [Muribaculum sp.]|nr:RagB/SusD family nutrient uptake outer membrane protein [Muribaculum sp.]